MKHFHTLLIVVALTPSLAHAGFLANCFKKTLPTTLGLPANSSATLDPLLTDAMNHSIPQIEQTAYKALDAMPGTPGFIRFNEIIDEAVRKNPDYAKALLRLAEHRLPYIKNEPTVVILSGGVADPWAPVLTEAARAEGMSIQIVKLPGSLSSGSHQLAEILKIEDPKARVAKLSQVHWEELAPV